MFQVIFTYDEPSRLWETSVRGAENEREAIQGFEAVLLTSRQATPNIGYNRATRKSDGSYTISVGVPCYVKQPL